MCRCLQRVSKFLVFFILLAQVGFSQEEAGSEEKKGDAKTEEKKEIREHQLEDEVIQGELLERYYKDTITSITKLNSFDLSNKNGITDFSDVLRAISNVRVSDGQITIRGINNYGENYSDNPTPLISTTVDGAWTSPDMGRRGWLPLGIWDLESVEVLRGSQSTEQGPNAAGGAIVLRTADPTFEDNGKARFSFGEYQTVITSAAHGGPIIDDVLAYRFAIDRQSSDGYLKDQAGRDDYGEYETNQIRGKLLFQPLKNERLQFKLTYEYTNGVSNNQNINGIEKRDSSGAAFTPPVFFDPEDRGPDPYLEGFRNPGIRTDQTRAVFETRYEINDTWSVKNKFAFTQFDTEGHFDVIASNDYFIYDDSAFIEEFIVSRKTDNWNSIFGLYFGRFDDDLEGNASRRIAGSWAYVNYFQSDKRTSYALFSSNDYKLNDNWTFNFGFRFEYEDIEVSKGQTDLQGTAGSASYTGDNDNSVFLPKIGVRWSPIENLSLGFQAHMGYRGGGVSFSSTDFTKFNKFDPEYLYNYELSLRHSLFENQFSYGVNLFYTDWQDKQVITSEGPGTPATTENAGEAHAMGLELELKYLPKAVTGLALDLNFGVLETEYDKFIDTAGTDFKGKEFSFAPKYTFSLGANYDHSSGFFTGARYTHTGKAYDGSPNTIEVYGKGSLDLYVGYRYKMTELTLWANNVTDEFEYYRKPNVYYIVANKPRVIGATFTLNW